MNRFQRIISLKRMLAIKATSEQDAQNSPARRDNVRSGVDLSSHPVFKSKPQMMELEGRLLFDAAIGATGLDIGVDALDDVGFDADNDDSEFIDPAVSAILADALDFTTAAYSKTIVFVDAAVSDLSGFLNLDDPRLEFLLIDSNEDGIGQIADALAGRSDVESVHIISHGQAGALLLGSSSVNRGDLSGYSAEMAIIGDALSDGGDLLIYGCNVAEGEIGQKFIQSISRMTGADVAASSDWTGDTSQGGDWELEASVGEIDVSEIFGTDGDVGYSNLLAAPTITAPATVTATEDVTYDFVTVTLAPEISVYDADNDDLLVVLSVSNGTLSVVDVASVLSGGNGTDTLVLFGSFTDINANLATLTYTGDPNFNGTDTLSISSDDLTATALSNTSITVTAVNDAPEITVPIGQTVSEDTQTLIPGLSISDVDDGAGSIAIDLSVAHGALDLNAAGITITYRSANSDALTLSGTKAALNTALGTLTYKSDQGFAGPDALSVNVNDNGNVGAGGPQIGNDVLEVIVIAKEDSDFNISDTDPTGGLVDDLELSDGLGSFIFPPPKLTVASAIGEFRVINDAEPMRAVVEGREDDFDASLNHDADQAPMRAGLSLDQEQRDFNANIFSPKGLADNLHSDHDLQSVADQGSESKQNSNSEADTKAPSKEDGSESKTEATPTSDAIDLSADKFDRDVDQLLNDLGAPNSSRDE
ncbi:MAG: DUF4347 domain-containing protein [Hyphomicrobiales bacterium]